MNMIGIIPARMNSSRFPGKPLAQILGKAMIYHVYWRSKMVKALKDVYIATCDSQIRDYCLENNMKVVMTDSKHPCASDRTAEAMLKIEKETNSLVDIAVMIQGDEPMLVPEMIDLAIDPMLKDDSILVVNFMSELRNKEDYESPDEIKVVVDNNNFALYFSREPIPSVKKWKGNIPMFKQVCIMLYRRDFLIKFINLEPTVLEKVESIDMLRILENGFKIKMILSPYLTYSVDTIEDLKQVEQLLEKDKLFDSYR